MQEKLNDNKLELNAIVDQILANQDKHIKQLSPLNPGANTSRSETLCKEVCMNIIERLDILAMVGLSVMVDPLSLPELGGDEWPTAVLSNKFTTMNIPIAQIPNDASMVSDFYVNIAKKLVHDFNRLLLDEIKCSTSITEWSGTTELSTKLLELADAKGSTHLWVSSDILAHLADATHIENNNEVGYVGKLGSVSVHLMPEIDNYLILSRKESNAECGLLFVPYGLLLLTGIVLDVKTMEPAIGVLTRYEILSSSKIDEYYTIVSITAG